MAQRPHQRPPRKAAARDRSAPKPSAPKPSAPLVDPKTVIAVREATAKAVHQTVRITSHVARAVATASARAARWIWPRLRRGTVRAGQAMGRASAAVARWSWSRRAGITRVGHRLLWWGALAILLLVGRALLGSAGDPELLASATIWFVTGLSMSVLVLIGAPEARMRVGAFALAGGHGALGLLAYLVAAG